MPERFPGAALALLLCLCVAPVCAASGAATAPDIRNFHQVNEHIFRGAQPSPLGLQELGTLGIKRVIDLRERGASTDFEGEQLKKLGINYINIPIGEFSAPSAGQMQAILKLLESGDATFIHCRRGKDRTGTAIACYRIKHDGWDNQRALKEARTYGMSSFERSMQHYILQFTPKSLMEPLPVLPH